MPAYAASTAAFSAACGSAFAEACADTEGVAAGFPSESVLPQPARITDATPSPATRNADRRTAPPALVITPR
ncbi:hypothetical protein GCM10010302_05370 [Streptomyces polychromogenes]|uniref:Uncharacterized protein n=1 Tax=Streptomyces polychromogenes TaxID=67342 RepID=A0ABN0V1J9_9ACTN